MKKLILSLLTLAPMFAAADGIPVPMEQQTRFNWVCTAGHDASQRVGLHLVSEGPQKALYMTYAGNIGTRLDDRTAELLLTKNYAALNGAVVKDRYDYAGDSRTLLFVTKGNRMDVRLIFDSKPSFKRDALNCQASF